MRARDFFSEAAGPGEVLDIHEAHVRKVPGRASPHRVWLGNDIEKRAVAYFEIEAGPTASFSVSQVISVLTTDVKEPTGSDPVNTVKLTCHEPGLSAVFFAFLDEIIERTGADRDALRLINEAAAEWRSLLLLARSQLTVHKAAGLYGELRFLEDSLTAIGAPALTLWQRTPQEMHDFIAETARVEVKTSAFQNRAAVTIHGLKQLQVPEGASLTLAVAEIQRHGGEFIDDVVERILDLGAERDVLTQKLQDAGYVIGMPGARENTFLLLSWRYWEIVPACAVLSRSTLPDAIANAVSAVSYTLDLSSLGPAETVFNYHRLLPPVGSASS